MRRSVSVDVDVDIDDVLCTLSDDDIRKIADQRGLKFKHIEHDDLIEAVQRIISATERHDLCEANRLANNLLDEIAGRVPDLSKEWKKIETGEHPFLRMGRA